MNSIQKPLLCNFYVTGQFANVYLFMEYTLLTSIFNSREDLTQFVKEVKLANYCVNNSALIVAFIKIRLFHASIP
jgi:hypothetical protein